MVIKTLKNMIRTFAFVMAGMTICAAIVVELFSNSQMISVLTLWQIALLSTVSALGNLFYLNRRDLSKGQMRFRIVCHYLYANAIVIGGAYLFHWFSMKKVTVVIVVFIMIAVVYKVIMMLEFQHDEKLAKDLNQQLRKRFPTEDNE